MEEPLPNSELARALQEPYARSHFSGWPAPGRIFRVSRRSQSHNQEFATMTGWRLSLARISLALAVAAISPLTARAAESASVTGKVTDAGGAALPDAVVSVAELKLGTTSGADGSFSFAGLPAGRYTLSVRRSGYAPSVITFTVPPASPLEIKLATTPFQIAPLDVTGTRGPIDPDRSAQPTASLSGDDVQKERSVSLAHAIDALP